MMQIAWFILREGSEEQTFEKLATLLEPYDNERKLTSRNLEIFFAFQCHSKREEITSQDIVALSLIIFYAFPIQKSKEAYVLDHPANHVLAQEWRLVG